MSDIPSAHSVQMLQTVEIKVDTWHELLQKAWIFINNMIYLYLMLYFDVSKKSEQGCREYEKKTLNLTIKYGYKGNYILGYNVAKPGTVE